MKYLLLPITVLLLCSTHATQGQDSLFKQGLLITADITPVFSYRSISTKDNTVVFETSSREAREELMIAFSTGIQLIYHFKKWVKFEMGINYEDLGYQERNTDIQFAAPHTGLPVSAISKTHYNYITLPFQLQYSFNPRIPHVFVSLGVNTHYFLGEKQVIVFTYADDTKQGFELEMEPEAFKKFVYSASIGIGIYQALDYEKKLFLKVAPYFDHFFTSATHSSIKTFLYHFGLNTGLTFKIK